MSFRFYCSLQAMENALYDVQANAPSRDLGDLIGSGESWAKHQPKDICFAQPLGFLRAHHLVFERLGSDLLGIDPTAIIPDLDDYLISLVIGIQPDDSTCWFTQTGALCWVFNAMSDSVAHQVRQWFGDSVKQAFVEIGILPAHHQVNLFAALLCNIADHSRKSAEKLLHWHHSDFHYRALQIIQYA